MPMPPEHYKPDTRKKGTICLDCYRKNPIGSIDVDQNIFLRHPFLTAKCSYCGQTKGTLGVILHADAA